MSTTIISNEGGMCPGCIKEAYAAHASGQGFIQYNYGKWLPQDGGPGNTVSAPDYTP